MFYCFCMFLFVNEKGGLSDFPQVLNMSVSKAGTFTTDYLFQGTSNKPTRVEAENL